MALQRLNNQSKRGFICKTDRNERLTENREGNWGGRNTRSKLLSKHHHRGKRRKEKRVLDNRGKKESVGGEGPGGTWQGSPYPTDVVW